MSKFLLVSLLLCFSYSASGAASSSSLDYIGNQRADCSTQIQRGLLCYQTADDTVWVGDGAAANQMGSGVAAPTPTLEESRAEGKDMTGAVDFSTAFCVCDGGGASCTGKARTCFYSISNTAREESYGTDDVIDTRSIEVYTGSDFNIYRTGQSAALNIPHGTNVVNVTALASTTTVSGTDITASGQLRGKCTTTIPGVDTYTMLSTDCAIANNDGDALEVDLIADPTGVIICFEEHSAGAITLDPNSTDQIIGGGLAAAAGEAVILASGTGNNVCLHGISTTQWFLLLGTGTVTEETP